MRRNVHLKSLLHFLIPVLLLCVPSIGHATAVVLNANSAVQQVLANGDSLTVNAGVTLNVAGTPAVTLAGNNAVQTFGTIHNNVTNTILALGGSVPPITIDNFFNISTTVVTNNAINLSAVTGAGAVIVTNGLDAELSGVVLLPAISDSTFNFSGSALGINGDIAKAAGVGEATVNINGTYPTRDTFNIGQVAAPITHVRVRNANTLFTINNSVVNLTGNFTVDANTSTFLVNAGSDIAGGTLINNGTVQIDDGSIHSNSATNNGHFISNGGVVATPTLQNDGTLDFNGGDISNVAISTTSANSVINMNANATFSKNISSGLINVNSSILDVEANLTGDVLISDGTLQIGGLPGSAHVIGDIGGIGASSVFQVSVDGFTTQGSISDVKTIIVDPARTFTIANEIRGFSQFTIPTTSTVAVNNNGILNTPSTGTVFNSGTVTVNTGGSIRVDSGGRFDNGATNATTNTLNMNGGTFIGNLISSFPSNLNVQNDFSTGGTMNFGSTATDGAITVAATKTFSIRHAISNFHTFTNSGTVILDSGASVSGNIGGTGVVNVNGNYSTLGTITAGTINVNSPATLTANNNLTTTGGLTVNSGGTLALNNSNSVTITGPASNNGTVTLGALSTPSAITGIYNQTNTGTLSTALMNTTNFGKLTVGAGSAINGTLQVTLPNGGVNIANGNTFDVVTAGGPLGAIPTLSAPQSLSLSFALTNPGGNILRVTATRLSATTVNNNPNFNGLAGTLDQIRTGGNPAFDSILNALDSITTQAGFEAALAGLSPITNGGIIMASFNTQDLILNRIFGRIDYRRHKLDYLRLTKAEIAENTGNSGYSAGDMDDGKNSYGPFMFVNNMKQSTRNGINGYNAWTGGLGIVADAALSKQLTIGGALTYAASDIIQAGGVKNKNVINAYQATLYASGEAYCILFGDIMYSIGQNNYRSWRYIPFLGSQQATANFKGTQKGGRLRGGYTIPAFGIEFAPMAYVQYFSLNIPGYVESGGPPGAALAVNSQTANLTRYAVGGRICNPSEANEFLPELHIFYTYDTQSPNFSVSSQFVAGGGSFITGGPIPPKSGVNVGASITALINPNFLVKGGFDFEAKKSYISNNFLLEFKYLWL